MSGVTTTEQTITQDGRTVKLYIMKPEQVSGKPGVLLFIHGGVWIVGNFQNHQRLLRDLVVGSGQIGVFVEYTPLPQAKFPTQLEECYAALKWVAEHAGEFGADGSRIAVAGNSVGGNMTAALALMAKDRNGPKISYQVLLIPATDASVDTASYHEYGTGRFLARAFMKYGWDLYAPDAKTRDNPYVSPLRASASELKGLPPALVITAENDPLRDEGEAYARKLKEAGVEVDCGSLQRHDPRLRAAERAAQRALHRSGDRADQRRPEGASQGQNDLSRYCWRRGGDNIRRVAFRPRTVSDLARNSRHAERAFKAARSQFPGSGGRLIGARQKVHQRLLRIVGGAHSVVGQIVLVRDRCSRRLEPDVSAADEKPSGAGEA